MAGSTDAREEANMVARLVPPNWLKRNDTSLTYTDERVNFTTKTSKLHSHEVLFKANQGIPHEWYEVLPRHNRRLVIFHNWYQPADSSTILGLFSWDRQMMLMGTAKERCACVSSDLHQCLVLLRSPALPLVIGRECYMQNLCWIAATISQSPKLETEYC